MKKKIWMINQSKIWGGGEKWFLENSIELLKNNFEVKLLCLSDSAIFKNARRKNLNCLKLYKFPINYMILFLNILQRKNIPDLVLTNSGKDYRLAVFLKLFLRCKYKIYFRRGLDKSLGNDFINRFIIKYYIEKIIVNALSIKKTILKKSSYITEDKIEIVYNGINTDDINNLKEEKIIFPDNNSTKIGVVARLSKQKNIPFLLNSLSKIPHINWTLYIIGDGEEKDFLLDIIKKFSMEKRVKMLGFINNVFPYVNKMDIFILPSSQKEGTPNALIEAMYLEKAIIALNCGSIP
ncbi:MAG TPA: glycosyltransferase, partial [bacterium]|nr:glycosyltransferase [bacterium]